MFRIFAYLIFSITFFALGSGGTFSQNSAHVMLEREGFKEFLRDSANISGAVVVGLQRQGQDEQGINLDAYIPIEWAGMNACMQVVSSDGRYEAYGPYLIPGDWVGGFTRLDFPTEYQEELMGIPHDGLGAMLLEGDCNDRNTGGVSVALWNSALAQDPYLMVNSFRADRVFMYMEGLEQPTLCERVDTPTPIAFDTKCKISSGQVVGKTHLEIYRVTGGKPSQPTGVEIWLPGTQ